VTGSAIVTGAASGIGRATARTLAAGGWSVTVADVNAAGLEALAGELGESALAQRCDVSSEPAVEALVAAHLERFGGLEGMVANAGIPDGEGLLETGLDTWERVLAVNLTGVFLCGRAAGRHMAAHGGGAIVNVASTYAEVTEPGAAAYSASKGGVRMLTKSMALELGPLGVRVNAVGPGWIRTGMNPLDDAVRVAAIERSVPLGRVGRPEDVAEVIAFLLGEGARYVSGETVFVDGGWLTSRTASPGG
jgi:NAD(P)-dependent dehydrogenase (short-subunit alcohol dehydrogenase family)